MASLACKQTPLRSSQFWLLSEEPTAFPTMPSFSVGARDLNAVSHAYTCPLLTELSLAAEMPEINEIWHPAGHRISSKRRHSGRSVQGLTLFRFTSETRGDSSRFQDRGENRTLLPTYFVLSTQACEVNNTSSGTNP